MSQHDLVCTGCGCLCDDIKAEVSSDRLAHIENACGKGAAYLSAAFNVDRRLGSLIEGEQCAVGEAIDEAKRLLSKARHPLIFGLDSSTCEAQQKAIGLARKRRATIDDASSLSYGPLIEGILQGKLPTSSFAEVKDDADFLVYWGSDAPNTHPRHLSRYTYYAYTDYNAAGWYPKVTLGCIDIRKTELSAMSGVSVTLQPGHDAVLMRSILDGDPSSLEEAKKFQEMIRKSRFCAIFCGLGLMNSLDADMSVFSQMVESLQESTRIAVMPMVSEPNLVGFTQALYQETGYVNQVGFVEGVSHGRSFSIHEQLRENAADCLILVDSDPYHLLPHHLLRSLRDIRVIYLGSFKTPVAGLANVVIPIAVPGIEQSGSMMRMDGANVELLCLRDALFPTVEDVMAQLMEG